MCKRVVCDNLRVKELCERLCVKELCVEVCVFKLVVCVCTICIDVKLHYAAGACGTHVLPHAMKLWT